MTFLDYTKSENFYEFIGEGGERVIIPSVHVVLIDDLGGFLTVINTNSGHSIGHVIL